MSAATPVRILAVDDNEATRYMVSRMLRRAGFEVLEAKTGGEALALAFEARPDLVILDVRLPDLSGIEVCRRLKGDRTTAGIPVLHLSASFTKGEDRAIGLEGGADGYLTHPVEGPELTATINALLRARSAEEQAVVAARQWQATFDAIGDPVCLLDRDGRFLRANGAMSALLGMQAEELVGEKLVECLEHAVGVPDRAALERLWNDATHAPAELHVGTRWFRATAAPVHDRWNAALGVVVVLTETTDRHREEDAQHFLAEASILLASSLDFHTTLASIARLVVRSMADFCEIALAGDEGQITHIEVVHGDPALEPLVAELEQLAGERALWRDGLLDQVMRTGRPAVSPVAELALDDAGPRAPLLRAIAPTSVMLVPLFARGRMLGVITFAATGSRRPYGGRDLELAEELVRRAALAVDNARLYEAALVANKAKADFLAVMSHELRTPLNAILGYTDLLEYGIGGPVTEQQREQLGRIKLSGRHLLTLIDEVLSFARLEAGKESTFLERTDLGAVAREAAALVEPLAAARRLRFRLDLPAAPLAVLTDPRKVRQILVNLLSNAVKFTEHGEVTLAIRAEEEEGAVLEVHDTGVGIPTEHLDRIFDPFWQVEQTQTRRVGGSGLGLSVVRRLARMLGGDVRVRSSVGSGSTFSLVLPLTGAPPVLLTESAEPAAEEHAVTRGNLRLEPRTRAGGD